MNLKEAFRYQNKLCSFTTYIENILYNPRNTTQEKVVHLRHKVDKDAEDESIIMPASTEYAGRITELARFLVWLGGQRETLSESIHDAKRSLDVDIDSESGLNRARQKSAAILGGMAALKSSEVLEPNGGTGYRFNAEGNQVSYRCDVRRVTTIDFDRAVVKKLAADLNKKADEISSKIDLALVTSEVDYEPLFGVNENFGDVFERFCEN